MEHPHRALVKAISYRLLGSGTTVAIVFALTGRFDLAGATGLADAGIKILAYYVHERIWARIPYGRTRPPEYHI